MGDQTDRDFLNPFLTSDDFMFSQLRHDLRPLAVQVATNIRGAARNPVGFFSMAAAMLLNDLAFFTLWLVYFGKFHSLRGWELHDLANMLGVATAAWGIAFTIGYNSRNLVQAFQDGTLDTYLIRPQPALPALTVSRLNASNFGDILAAPVYWFVFGGNTLTDLPLLVLLSLLGAVIMLTSVICIQMLVVWLRANPLFGDQFLYMLICSTTLPQHGYGIWGKIVLFTVLPGGFIGMVPVEILRDFSPSLLGLLIAAAAFYSWLAHLSFQAMLRCYTSATRVG